MWRVCPDVSLVPDILKPRTRPMCETESRSHAGHGNEASCSYFSKAATEYSTAIVQQRG